MAVMRSVLDPSLLISKFPVIDVLSRTKRNFVQPNGFIIIFIFQ